MWAERHGRELVLAVAVATAACFAVIGLVRHGNWWSGIDLGLFSQSVWHWGNLEAPLSTAKGNTSLLGDHFSPIVALLAPASWTGREPEALVIIQAVLVAASIPPVHSYARDRLPALPALAIAVAYAGSWLLWTGALFDFHEVAFAPLLVALGILWGDRRRWGLFAVAMVLLACVKEDMPIVIVFFGIWLLALGERRAGAATIAGGVLAYLLAVEVVIPHYGDGFEYWTYDAMGSGPLDALLETAKRPWLPFEVALDQPEKRRLLAFLALPFLFLPLLSRVSIIAIPLVAERLLSSNPLLWKTTFHYGLPLAPVLAMAAAGGLATVLAWLPAEQRKRAVKVVFAAGIALAVGAIVAGPKGVEAVRKVARTPDFDAAAEAAVNRVPANASVITHKFVYAHVAARESADFFREGAANAEWMILAPFAERGDAAGSRSPKDLNEAQIRPRLGAYGAVWERGGWIVLRRDAHARLDGPACAELRIRAHAAPARLDSAATVAALCGRG